MSSVVPDPLDIVVGGVVLPRARSAADGPATAVQIPTYLIAVLAPTARTLPDRITARIRAEVEGLSAGRDMHRLINEAVAIAVAAFLAPSTGDEQSRVAALKHFRDLGRARALAGESARPVREALQVSATTVWEEMRGLVHGEGVSARAAWELGAAVMHHHRQLGVEFEHGFAQVRSATDDPRGQLVQALMSDRPESVLAARAEVAGWPMPDTVVVLIADLHGAVPPSSVSIGTDVLTRAEDDRIVVIADASQVAAARTALLRLNAKTLVGVSWSVPRRETRDAYRWVRKALALARSGRLPSAGRVVECAEHMTMLWWEADPALLATLVRERLAPLLAMTLHRRVDLAVTLERWLEFGESAPALAKALHVHPNTVRNRLGVLRGLFGDRLDDPNDRQMLRACLRTTLPKWEAERAWVRQRRARTRGSGPTARVGDDAAHR